MKFKSKFAAIIVALSAIFVIAILCVSCGKKGESPSGSDSGTIAKCDHETLYPELMDGKDLGLCEGAQISVLTCKCGKVKKFDVGASMVNCKIEEEYFEDGDYEDGKTADGKDYEKFSVTCKDCGALYEMYTETKTTLCKTELKGYIKIKKNNVEKFNADIEYDEHYSRRAERETVNISDLTTDKVCGGYIALEKCPDCGELIGVDYENLDCDGLFEKTPTTREYVDKDGVKHSEICVACDDCKLRLFGDAASTALSDCVAYGSYVEKIVVGEKTVYEYLSDKGFVTDHETETSFKKLGESCYDGVKVTQICKKCKLKCSSYTHYGHISDEKTEQILISETCNGIIEIERCSVCGELDKLDGVGNDTHSFEMIEDKTFTDKNGVEHDYTLDRCSKCGCERSCDEYRVFDGESQCEYRFYKTKKITASDKTFYTCTESHLESSHKYKYSAKLKEGSTSCEDGVIVTEKCDVCGLSGEWERSGHYIERLEKDLSNSPCGGYIAMEHCIVCDKLTDLDLYSGNHKFETVESRTYTDKNGKEHSYYRVKCEDCGVEYGEDKYKVLYGENPCEWKVYNAKTITYLGKTYNCDSEYYSQSHNYKYTATLKEGSTSCEDGIIVKEFCTVCGNTNEWERSEHYIVSDSVGLSAKPCGGSVSVDRCIACDTIIYVYSVSGEHSYETVENGTYTDENGIEYTYFCDKCSKCGLIIREEWYKETNSGDPCRSTMHGTKTITDADKTIICNYTHDSYNHIYVYTFTLNGDTCEDGWSAVSACAICLEEGSQLVGDIHESLLVLYCALGEIGACEGTYFEAYSCACGCFKRVYENVCDDAVCVENNVPLADGEYSHTERVITCDKCGLKIVTDIVGVRETDEESGSDYVLYKEKRTISLDNIFVLEEYLERIELID